MLQNAHFYHSLTKKAVILFGRIFDDISIVRVNNQTGKETQRFLVPIIYSPKEKMITRIESDPTLLKQVSIILPRMSFEITGISYDPSRKQNSLLRTVAPNNQTSVKSQYVGTPYDITFALNVYARNIDDGTQIVEQILPFFNPDFTVSTKMVPDLGFIKDVPIILDSITNDIQYEGNFDSVRYVYWTLTFTMKMHFYGPISTPKVITAANTRVFADQAMTRNGGYISTFYYKNANGTFTVNDTVYQGNNPLTANAYGKITYHDSKNKVLQIDVSEGIFAVNNNIHAVSTNAVCQINTYISAPEHELNIVIRPDPITAKPGDDYGYTETVYRNRI